MSAFMVSDKHLRYLVFAWRRYCAPPGSGITIMGNELDGMAMLLKWECARSIAHAYPRMVTRCPWCRETVCDPGWRIRIGSGGYNSTFIDPAGEWVSGPLVTVGPCQFAMVDRFDGATLGIDPVGAIKVAQCYRYQSNEHPEWEASDANKIVEMVIDGAISKLPGYDAAPWGVQ